MGRRSDQWNDYPGRSKIKHCTILRQMSPETVQRVQLLMISVLHTQMKTRMNASSVTFLLERFHRSLFAWMDTDDDAIPYAKYLTGNSTNEVSTLNDVKRRLGLLDDSENSVLLTVK